jgi:hypothetical protein
MKSSTTASKFITGGRSSSFPCLKHDKYTFRKAEDEKKCYQWNMQKHKINNNDIHFNGNLSLAYLKNSHYNKNATTPQANIQKTNFP